MNPVAILSKLPKRLSQRKRVLIVNDDTAVLRIMREALQSILHWEIDTSPKPEYGFELALKKTYDLMIFDFSMPMIDGRLLFLLISKVYENSSPPRIIPPCFWSAVRARMRARWSFSKKRASASFWRSL